MHELVQITTPVESSGDTPTLELQFGDIATRTTLLADNDMHYLIIIAQLPRSRRSIREPRAHAASDDAISAPFDLELVWHADKGCYMALRQMPIGDFTDEASVLDAILDTADRSRAWYIAALRRRSKTE